MQVGKYVSMSTCLLVPGQGSGRYVSWTDGENLLRGTHNRNESETGEEGSETRVS